MGYSAIATNIRKKLTTIDEQISNIESISFDDIWKGLAHDSLISSLNLVLSKLKKERDKINTYARLLDNLQTYKNNQSVISTVKNKLYNTSNIPENQSTIKYLSNLLRENINANAQLKTSLQNAFGAFGVVGTELDLITYTSPQNPQYLIDVQELKNQYSNKGENKLIKLNDGESLYNYYNQTDANGNIIPGSGKAYIEGLITNIKETSTGREAVVNSTLTMLKLAADKGVKVDYELITHSSKEPYVSTEVVASGADCVTFAAWATDKGTPGGFQWRTVDDFKKVGESLSDWTKAQPGDIFTSSSHVGIIIENDPSTNTFICAEAGGRKAGLVLQQRTYSSMKKGYCDVRDMTNVYNGTQNTNRERFNKYVDWNTYQRKV